VPIPRTVNCPHGSSASDDGGNIFTDERSRPRVQPRLNMRQANPEVMAPMSVMSQAVRQSGLDPRLIQLIDIRASQINGCGH
jgi:alkylhydroperoxidase family enzyme